jgi:lysophospholipase L1-like esterase
LRLFLFAVLLVPALVLVGELGVRLWVPRIDPLEVFVPPVSLREENVGGLVEYDSVLWWRWKSGLRAAEWEGGSLSTNAAHLPDDRALEPKRGLRIVCLGDSLTAGRGIKDGKSYPGLLEQKLRERFPSRGIDVLPMACAGYSSAQALAWLRRDIASWQPDIVVACLGADDVRDAAIPDSLGMPVGAQESVRRLIARSQLLLYVARSAQQRRGIPGQPAAGPRATEAEYVAHFATMEEICRGRGVSWAIVFPMLRDAQGPVGIRLAAYRAALRKDAEARKIPMLDVPELSGNAGLFAGESWLTPQGNEVLAAMTAEWLGPIIEQRK